MGVQISSRLGSRFLFRLLIIVSAVAILPMYGVRARLQDPPCDPGGGTGCYSPIIIDVSGDGFQLTDAANGVDFDMNGDGYKERVAWTAPDSNNAFLVLDRNGNGAIEIGGELFGNYSPQSKSSQRNGFIALAEFDKPENGGNSNGVIDEYDQIFDSLRLWQDKNHNGVSEPEELHKLPELGITKLYFDYKVSKRVDEYGNVFRYRAKVGDDKGIKAWRWAWDVFLRTQ